MYCKRNTICISFFVLFSLLLFNLSNIPYPSLNAYAQYSNQGINMKIHNATSLGHSPSKSNAAGGGVHPPSNELKTTHNIHAAKSAASEIHPPSNSVAKSTSALVIPTSDGFGSNASSSVHLPNHDMELSMPTHRGTPTGSFAHPPNADSSSKYTPRQILQKCIIIYLPSQIGAGISNCLKMNEKTPILNLFGPALILKPFYGGWCSFGDQTVKDIDGNTYCLGSNN
jgi:hypothetical protein